MAISTSFGYELEQVDELLSVLGSKSDEPWRLVEEHVQFARSYLLGAMPHEYEVNLEMARTAARKIENSAGRAEVLSLLDGLLSVHRAR